MSKMKKLRKRVLCVLLVLVLISNIIPCNSVAYANTTEILAQVRILEGETYSIFAPEDTIIFLSGEAIYNETGGGDGPHLSQYVYANSFSNIDVSYHLEAWNMREITVVSGELLLQYDSNVKVEKVNHNAIDVYILKPNESIEIKVDEDESWYHPITFNCYNSGITLNYFDSSQGQTKTEEWIKDTFVGKTFSWQDYDTLNIKSTEGVSVIYFDNFIGKSFSVSKKPASIEEAQMIYHPFSLKEKNLSIGVGEEYALTITSNIEGYYPDIKFYANGKSYFEGLEDFVSSLSFKINIKDMIVTGITSGKKQKIVVEDCNTGYMEGCVFDVTAPAKHASISTRKKNTSNKEQRQISGEKKKSIQLSKIKTLKVIVKNKSVIVSWKRKSGVAGYQLQYARNRKFTKKRTKNRVSKTRVVKLKKLEKGKMYYFRVRTFKKIDGKKMFSKWSKIKTCRIK